MEKIVRITLLRDLPDINKGEIGKISGDYCMFGKFVFLIKYIKNNSDWFRVEYEEEPAYHCEIVLRKEDSCS